MAEVGPGEILQYVEAISYPATKDELVNTAIIHDAPDDVVATLARLPERDYENGNDISAEIEGLD